MVLIEYSAKMETKLLNYDDGVEDALNIRNDVFVKELNVPLEEEVDDIDRRAVHIIVYENSIPVGTGRVFNEKGKWFIGRLAVIEDKRGCGIGKLVMEKLMDYAKSKGARKIFLYAQTYISKFYEKLGFMEFGDLFMDAGIPHIEMYKKL